MKKIVIFLLLLKVLTINCMGGNKSVNTDGENKMDPDTDSINFLIESYGMEINNFYTYSGFNSGMEAAIFVKGYNKTLQLGAYFDTYSCNLSGFVLSHKHYIIYGNKPIKKFIDPYAFYNFIYRQTVYDKPLLADPAYSQLLYSDKARYSSLEHYFGIGTDIHVYNFIYFNINVGMGGYFGSIKKPVSSSVSGLYIGSNGLSGIVKFGFGFKIP